MEQGPRATVKVTGNRGGKAMSFEVPLGIWGIMVRPHFFDEEALEAYTEGQAAVALKEFERGIALWENVVKSVGSADETSVACWMYIRIADAWIEARRWKEGQEAYESARGMAVGDIESVCDSVHLGRNRACPRKARQISGRSEGVPSRHWRFKKKHWAKA